MYDVPRGQVVDFFNHPYKKYNAAEVTADLCVEALWQTEVEGGPGQLEYLEGTGILHHRQSDERRAVDRYFFAPMVGGADTYPDRTLVMLMRVENRSRAALPARTTARLDFRVGAGDQPDA